MHPSCRISQEDGQRENREDGGQNDRLDQRLDSRLNRFVICYPVPAIILILVLITSCDGLIFLSYLDKIKERGEMIVITRNAPTSYYENNDGQFQGIEYDMVTAFAEYLQVKVRFVVKNTAGDMLEAIDNMEGDFVAGGLTKTDQRLASYTFGPVYQRVQQQVICRRNNGPVPSSLDEFSDTVLWVSKNTSYEQHLKSIQDQYPELEWQSSEELGTEDLLEKVWKREIGCTVSDSNIFNINRRYYPELVLAFSLTEPEPLSWVMPRDADELKEAMNNWYQKFREEDKMKILLEKYYGFFDEYDYVATRRFHRSVKTTLPKYRQWFEQAGEKYDLDWQLLAAVSYQESHWNPLAKSPTGVRGIMMITLLTAKHLKLDNRLDPEASIFAGAKYLSQLRSRLPDHIQEPQRTWMALATYNMGYGHFKDARTLAKRLEKDPDRWDELESVLPLLARKKYYSNLKHGYARGGQAVHYVKNIRNYRDQLSELLLKEEEQKAVAL